MSLIQVSTWLRRIELNGRSANPTDPAARAIARSVPFTHTWRAAQSA
jgi:hypothetical protein